MVAQLQNIYRHAQAMSPNGHANSLQRLSSSAAEECADELLWHVQVGCPQLKMPALFLKAILINKAMLTFATPRKATVKWESSLV